MRQEEIDIIKGRRPDPADDLSEQELPPCKICKKVWKRKDTSKYGYHVDVGVVCLHHAGVEKWYLDKLSEGVW